MKASIVKIGRQRTTWYFDKLEGLDLNKLFHKKTKYSMGQFEVFAYVGESANFVEYHIKFRLGKDGRWHPFWFAITALYDRINYYNITGFKMEVA